MANALCQRGARTVIVTAGSDGICFARNGERLVLPAPPVPLVDVSGAGDALVAGTLYGRLMDYDPATSLRIGLKAAGMTIASEEAGCPELSVDAITDGLKP
jgi:pseudouridine kinase